MVDSFNLVTEPWIRIRRRGAVENVSLRECFATADKIDSLAGELPSQDVAVLRLLLAVLAGAVAEDADDPVERWESLWNAPQLPMGAIDRYLDRWSGRFDLWDPERPFMQTAGLEAAKTSGVAALIADLPAGHQFFTTRTGSGAESLDNAEAVRWLVHAQSYDVSGIKTGSFGDDRVKGGKGYPIGTGWAGRLGVIVLEGKTLRETLLLNLVLDKRKSGDPGTALWERDDVLTAAVSPHDQPTGWRDLMTWPSRRILLYRKNGRVVDALVCNGDRLEPQNRQRLEVMSGWRRSANQERKASATVYMPSRHDPERAIWRGLGGLLAQQSRLGAIRNDAPSTINPPTIEWLAQLRHNEALDGSYPVSLRAVGMSYGTQDASVDAMVDDALQVRVAVLADDGLRLLAVQAAGAAEQAVKALGRFAANLARASGGEDDGEFRRAAEEGYFRLDSPYRAWALKLSAHTDVEVAEQNWQQTAYELIRAASEELMQDAGRVAWVGRQVDQGHLDSALAHIWFLAALRKALPLAANLRAPREEVNV